MEVFDLLKEIRSREYKINQRLAEARKAAGRSLDAARREAEAIVEAAAQEGAEAGQEQADELLTRTETEIRQAEAKAQAWEETLRTHFEEEGEQLLEEMLNLVLGRESEGGRDDG